MQEEIEHKTVNLAISTTKLSARTLLRESSKSIGEISEELGYSSCEHFSWSFKKYCGMSPSEYRKGCG